MLSEHFKVNPEEGAIASNSCLFHEGPLSEQEQENALLHAELSINPLASRIARMLDGSNFKEFARFLAAFSGRASEEKKLKFMFEVGISSASSAGTPTVCVLSTSRTPKRRNNMCRCMTWMGMGC